MSLIIRAGEWGAYPSCVRNVCRTSHAHMINELSFMQGFGAASPEIGTTVLPGLPGANPHRPACPESGLCNARVHTVWVGIQRDTLIHTLLIETSCSYSQGKMYSGCFVCFFPPVECVHLAFHC